MAYTWKVLSEIQNRLCIAGYSHVNIGIQYLHHLACTVIANYSYVLQSVLYIHQIYAAVSMALHTVKQQNSESYVRRH